MSHQTILLQEDSDQPGCSIMKGRFVDEKNQAKKGPSSFALYFLEILLLRLTILFFFFFWSFLVHT